MAKRIFIAVFLLGSMVAILFLYMPRTNMQQTSMSGPTAQAIGGPFTLTDTKGNTVTHETLKGRRALIFFGFTHCPDICPATLNNVKQALDILGTPDAVQVVFITVDPERDTQQAMADYMTHFDPRFMGLTGTPEQTAAVTKAFRVYASKLPIKDAEGKNTGDYTMSHSGMMYLMSADGAYIGHISANATADEIAAALKSA
jgi:protein SCO1/2